MNLHQKITSSIHKIQNHWERTENGNFGISRIDKDILIADIRQLYDLVFELEIEDFKPLKNKDIDLPQVEDRAQMAEEKTKPQTTVKPVFANAEKSIKENLVESPGQVSDEEKPELANTAIPEEYVPEYGKIPEIEALNDAPEPEEELQRDIERPAPSIKKTSLPKAQKSTSDQFQASITLGDVYQKNGDNSLAARIQKNKITDIKSAIGINDRFLFINEIFKGDAKKYKQTIEALNNFSNYHEALELVENVKIENKVENQDAVVVFLEIIKRKFR